jgi:hypothetical protein
MLRHMVRVLTALHTTNDPVCFATWSFSSRLEVQGLWQLCYGLCHVIMLWLMSCDHAMADVM